MAIDVTRIQALCFDVDGTLRDTDDQYVNHLMKILHPARFLIPGDDEAKLARRIVMSLESPVNQFYSFLDRLGIDDKLARIVRFFFREANPQANRNILLIDGIRRTFSILHPHYPMAIISARGRRGTMVFLEQFDLVRWFHCIATAQTVKYTKPFPDPVLWAADQMGVPPEGCLMVGDTTVDIRSGKAAGAQTIGVLSGFGEEDELRSAGADLILPSVNALPEVLFAGEISPENSLYS